MHYYGECSDEFFDIIEKTASEIGRFLVRWGRIRVFQTKEKYGTVRVYCAFGFDSVHELIWPRHCWIHKWWPYSLDLKASDWVMPVFNRLIFPYQKFIYRMAYKRAVAKHESLWKEILVMADHGKLLDGIYGYKESDHWTEVK